MPKPITFLPDPPADTPGPFYVSSIDGETYWLLAGPFATHAEALEHVEPVKALAHEEHPRSVWYGFGTCRISDASLAKLDCPANAPLGITPTWRP